MSKNHYVYRITNLIENKHYYGCRSTKFMHKEDLGIKYFSSSRDKDFIKDQKSNPDNYKYKVIRTFETRKEAIQFEIKLHNYFNVGINESFYNKCKQSSIGWDTTGMALYIDETGNKIFLKVIEANKRNLDAESKGRKFSEDSRKKMSQILTGRKFTKETREKMSKWQKGKKKWDEEGRKILSAAHKGKKLSEEHKINIGLSIKGKKKPTKVCPYCGFECAANVAKRWHFDNCKHKTMNKIK